VLGVPFYVMELATVGGRAGAAITHRPPVDQPPYEYGMQYDGRRHRRPANVDHLAVGLADFGKPDHFLARQVDRWAKPAAELRSSTATPGASCRATTSPSPGCGQRADRQGDQIIHGDMGTPNALFAFEPQRG
jgi:aminoglycoside phosphotransferase (APT) family kinase protein